MADHIASMYERYVPRWIKVIRWREWGRRILIKQKIYAFFIFMPACAFYVYGFGDHNYAYKLLVYRPQTEEERMALKRNNFAISVRRNWDIGQYNQNMPPLYDMSERRLKYPQYYKGRYDGYKKDKQIEDNVHDFDQEKVQKFWTV